MTKLRISMVLAALTLASCSDLGIELPKVAGTEVPAEVFNAPRVVPVPPPQPETRDWPLLGTVPFKPKDFTPQPSIGAAKDEMHYDRNSAISLEHDYQAEPPVVPSVSDQ